MHRKWEFALNYPNCLLDSVFRSIFELSYFWTYWSRCQILRWFLNFDRDCVKISNWSGCVSSFGSWRHNAFETCSQECFLELFSFSVFPRLNLQLGKFPKCTILPQFSDLAVFSFYSSSPTYFCGFIFLSVGWF